MVINEFQKYPTDKKKFDKNWIRAFGVKCIHCKGNGIIPVGQCFVTCPKCKGTGKTEREKK